jgi:hypothetical protein
LRYQAVVRSPRSLYPERRTATLAMRLRFPMPDLDTLIYVKSCISCNTACSRSCLRVRVHSVERRSNPALFLAWCQLSGLRHRRPCHAVAAKRKCASYGRRSALSRSYFSSPTAIKRRSGDRLRKACPPWPEATPSKRTPNRQNPARVSPQAGGARSPDSPAEHAATPVRPAGAAMLPMPHAVI